MKGMRYKIVSYDGKEEMYIYRKEGLALLKFIEKKDSEDKEEGMKFLMNFVNDNFFKEEKRRFLKTKKYMVRWPYTYDFIKNIIIEQRINNKIDKLINL